MLELLDFVLAPSRRQGQEWRRQLLREAQGFFGWWGAWEKPVEFAVRVGSDMCECHDWQVVKQAIAQMFNGSIP